LPQSGGASLFHPAFCVTNQSFFWAALGGKLASQRELWQQAKLFFNSELKTQNSKLSNVQKEAASLQLP
jgi:hypothetical protein